MLTLKDGKVRQLTTDGWGAALSPDQTRVAFQCAPDVCLMDIGGTPRPLLTPPTGYRFLEPLAWSGDGKRLAYGVVSLIGDRASIRTHDLHTGVSNEILSDPRAGAFCWTRDGRIIYARTEDYPNETSANLWEIAADGAGRSRGKPRRLTNWVGFLLGSLHADDSGTRLTLVRQRFRRNIYVGELKRNGSVLAEPKRLTFDDWFDWPTGWTLDSRNVLFYSDRGGDIDVFRQSLHERDARPIASGPGETRDPRQTADGRWILYLAWPNESGRIRRNDGRLMRRSVDGSAVESVFAVRGYPGPVRVNPDATVPALEPVGHPRFRCPSREDRDCVLSEQTDDGVVFTAFDPVAGRKDVLAKLPSGRGTRLLWDLSPDGRRLAVVMREPERARIQLLSRDRDAMAEVSTDAWAPLESIAWAADGKSLFSTRYAPDGFLLLRIALDGEVRVLYKGRFFLENPVPSPDGRHLAFGDITPEGNLWVIENLR